MSDLTATNISGMDGSCCNPIFLILLLCCCNNGCGMGNMRGFGGDNSCLWIILLLCCCNKGCGSIC